MQRNGFNYAVETHHGNHPKQCISETEREVGFYRHDQWGFACLADDTRVLTGSSSSGVITVSKALLPAQSSTKGGNIEIECTYT